MSANLRLGTGGGGCGVSAAAIGDDAVPPTGTRRDDAIMASNPHEGHTRPGLRATSRSVAGGLRHEVEIDEGRHLVVTDEPENLGGHDTGPAPHELLPAALASCISTTMLLYARSRGWDIGDVRVEVDYDHESTPRHFAIAVHLDSSLPPEQVKRLTKVAEGCPVRRAIESGIQFDEEILLDLRPL
jgi:putative redox protein